MNKSGAIIKTSREGAPSQTVSTSYKKEVIFMKNEYIAVLLRLIEQGIVSSVTVTKGTVTIRIKK